MALRFLLIQILLVTVFSNPVIADEVWNKLINARSLKCSFKEGVSMTWKASGVSIERDLWKGVTHFDSIDLREGKARIIGNQGSADITAFVTPAGITLVESTGLGNLVFTTVFARYKPETDEFCAVMSRHMNLIGASLPSQYYGTCKVWE